MIGDKKKSDKVKNWKTDEKGIFEASWKWKNISWAVKKGWEGKYEYDLDQDGLIEGKGAYKLNSSIGGITLQNESGKTYNSKTNKKWNATAAVETESGYQVLLTGTAKKNKNGMVNQLTTDKNGTIQNWAGWKDISWAANNGWESQFQSDINKNGIIDNESTLNFQANQIPQQQFLLAT